MLEQERRAAPLAPQPAEVVLDLPVGHGARIEEIHRPRKAREPLEAAGIGRARQRRPAAHQREPAEEALDRQVPCGAREPNRAPEARGEELGVRGATDGNEDPTVPCCRHASRPCTEP